MPDDGQDKDTRTDDATINGGGSGDGQKTAKTTYTQAEFDAALQREADRRVGQAQKKWRDEQAELIADKTKDADTKLAELTTRASEAEARATFAEGANKEGVVDIKAAYAVAKSEGLIKDGKPDWKRLRDEHPALFGATTRKTSANDTPDLKKGKPDMNALLRAAAGVAGGNT